MDDRKCEVSRDWEAPRALLITDAALPLCGATEKIHAELRVRHTEPTQE